jgi:hypothetical protein
MMVGNLFPMLEFFEGGGDEDMHLSVIKSI